MKKITKKELMEKLSNQEDISNFDYSDVTDMSNLLLDYKGKSIPYIDTTNVTNMNYMFYNCSNLITIPKLNTGNVKTMTGIFSGCSSLTTIPEIDTSKVHTTNEMFFECTSLTHLPKLDFSSVILSPTGKAEYMFHNCENLKLELSNLKYNTPDFFFKVFNFPHEMMEIFSITDTITLLHQNNNIDTFSKNTLLHSKSAEKIKHHISNKLGEIIEMDIPF